jgi:hypothetical protein
MKYSISYIINFIAKLYLKLQKKRKNCIKKILLSSKKIKLKPLGISYKKKRVRKLRRMKFNH